MKCFHFSYRKTYTSAPIWMEGFGGFPQASQASAGKAVQRAVSRPEDFWNNEDNLLIQVVDSPNRLEALPDQLFTNID